MNIAIFGYSGFIGSHISKILKDKHNVIKVNLSVEMLQILWIQFVENIFDQAMSSVCIETKCHSIMKVM